MMKSLQKICAADTRREIDDYYSDIDMTRRENETFQSGIKEKLDWIRQSLLDMQFVLVDDDERHGSACPYSDEEIRTTAFLQFLHENRGRSL